MSAATPQQQQAIDAVGNVLVVAGAGTGKTHTLVQCSLARVLAQAAPVSLDHVLLVTFTEAAAAELRSRIRARLQAAAAHQAENRLLAEQLALVDSARISTLHGFCLQVVREHFHALTLDPHLTVLDEAQAGVLAAEVLDRVLERHYAGRAPGDEAVRQLILTHGGGGDTAVRELVQRIHHYTQTLPEPAGWLEEQRAAFLAAQPTRWRSWWLAGIEDWREGWLESLPSLVGQNEHAQRCWGALREAPKPLTASSAAALLRCLLAVDTDWPPRRKSALRAPLEKLFAEAEFFDSLAGPAAPAAGDPLQEDWDWARPHLLALLELTREFGAEFATAKREAGALDFHDLEQFTLRLLCAPGAGGLTPIARQWQERLRLVFVDEYQDINAAQDRILQALSRGVDAAPGNRFLVGDVKQSIYRFRLANPHIFQAYAQAWGPDRAAGQVVALSENFRSHEGILSFVNTLFAALMRPEVGGVDYPPAARLRFGNAAGRPHHAVGAGPSAALGPRVELNLRLTGPVELEATEKERPNGSDSWLADQTNTEKEASLIGQRLRELREAGTLVWDERRQGLRPVEWGDMVILLRAPRRKVETYAKAFARLGVPLWAARRGLYQTTEVTDLLSLLLLLDNPLQDIPALAVLRSPLARFSLDELALIRLHQRSGLFWTALRAFAAAGGRAPEGPAPVSPPAAGRPAEAEPPAPGAGERETADLAALRRATGAKVEAFLACYSRWRASARRGALSHCLEAVLDETHYEDWLLTQERGEQRRANVRRLLELTRQFDQFQRQGLFRFLKFVEAQQALEFDPEPALVEADNAVRLLSMHQSKGLEFPLVVVADLGKPFNFDELRGTILLDEVFGLCPTIKPPSVPQTYPSLPYWLAARRQRREVLGEELRLLYVALTRARDWLILAGTAPQRAVEEKWTDPGAERLPVAQLLGARSCLDWLGPLFPRLAGQPEWWTQARGQGSQMAWRCHHRDEAASPPLAKPVEPVAAPTPDPAALEALRQRVTWRYPHPAAVVTTAKASVSALRRRVQDETAEEASRWFQGGGGAPSRPPRIHPGATAAAFGLAHHRFLELFALDRAGSLADLTAEADRLFQAGHLSQLERAALDLPRLAAFWSSSLGQRIRAAAPAVRRELAFTARFGVAELRQAGLPITEPPPPEEFMVVQGVADLVVLQPDQLWLVDFKTDALSGAELPQRIQRYRPQVLLYASALGRVYRRPVGAAWLHFLALDRSVPVVA